MRLVLFQPDIAENTGSALRLCACLGVELHIIEPCGFPLDEKRLKRVAMDYLELVRLTRHASWEAFQAYRQEQDSRLLLLSSKAAVHYTTYQYRNHDFLLLGRESAGVPDFVRQAADAALTIPMQPPARSLNVVLAGAMVLGEALRQTR